MSFLKFKCLLSFALRTTMAARLLAQKALQHICYITCARGFQRKILQYRTKSRDRYNKIPLVLEDTQSIQSGK